jgi:TolB-like protein/tetratricopeptide (TPR) repeat protein/DNA-binding winged helix-turn-helix (wHTH) protein
MDAGDLRGGFRLGDWLVEPREQRVSGRAGTFVLPTEQFQLLLCLAEHCGEEVERSTLAERAWPGDPDADFKLTQALAALQAVLGDLPQHPRHLVPVGDDGFALIAHVEPSSSARPVGDATVAQMPSSSRESPTFFGRPQRWIAELQRRQVFKVAASYLVGMWIVLQVAEVTFSPLHFPEWWVTALTILAVLGLPIVVSLAWTYEITPGGIVVDTGDTLVGVKLPRARRAVAPVIVAGVTAMAGVTGFAWWRSIQTAEPAVAAEVDQGVPSIAVLPLVDMSPGGGNGYLGDGLSEELSMRLAQVPGLRVASRTSAFEFKDKSVDVRRIGQSLGVRNVLEGSVRREGDNLRVTVQLIDAHTGYHVWAGNFDRSWRDVLAMQDEVARSVTDALQVVLSPGARQGIAKVDAPDVQALEPYLAGLALLRRSADMSVLNEARQHFRQSLDIAPSFAPARAGLCQVGARKYRRTHDPADLSEAERSCTEALALDPGLVETEKALGALYVSSGRFVDAEPVYRRIIERDPRNADGYIGLARAFEGRGDLRTAEEDFRRAVAVEPGYWETHRELGGFLFEHGKIDQAVAAYRRVTALTPSSASAFNNLGAALEMQGDLAGSAEAFRSSLRLEPSPSAYSNLATVHYYEGRYDEAAANYARATELTPQDYAVWGNLADARWQMAGHRAEAIDLYTRASAMAERDLLSNPVNAGLLAQLAHYHGRIGNAGRAVEYLDRARSVAGHDLYVEYAAAVLAADRGDHAAALAALRSAVALGYPRRLVKLAPDFALLRHEAGFRGIVEEGGAATPNAGGRAEGAT